MQLASPTRLRLSTAGLTTILGPLRAEILAMLWRLGRATSRDIHQQLDLPRTYAYSTVRSAMQSLAADGYLTCLPDKQGNANVYIPRVGQEALSLQVMHQVLESLAADFPAGVAAYVGRYNAPRAPHLRLVWSADRQRQYSSS